MKMSNFKLKNGRTNANIDESIKPIVRKFGGGCTGSPYNLGRIIEILEGDESQSVVVVSAPKGEYYGDVTDYLLKDMEYTENMGYSEVLEEILRGFYNMMTDIDTSMSTREIIEQLMRELLSARKEMLKCGTTERLKDSILSFGERITAIIISDALNNAGISSVNLTGGQAGIITDSKFGDATPLQDSYHLIRKKLGYFLSNGITPIVTGFIGQDIQGNITTFGRGGSDFTAAIIASALRTDKLELWKTVNGLCVADPAIVPKAETITTLSFGELRDLLRFKPKIIHHKVIDTINNEISMYIKNIERPDNAHTLISAENSPGIKCIVHSDDIQIISECFGRGKNAGIKESNKGVFILGIIGTGIDMNKISEISTALRKDIIDTQRSRHCIKFLLNGRSVEEYIRKIYDILIVRDNLTGHEALVRVTEDAI